jgi:hypothetical protein
VLLQYCWFLIKLSPPEFSLCFIMLIFISHLILVSSVMITACTTYINIQKFSILPMQCIYLCRMILRVNTVTSLNNINGLVAVTKKHCVYCEVGTEVHKVNWSCDTQPTVLNNKTGHEHGITPNKNLKCTNYLGLVILFSLEPMDSCILVHTYSTLFHRLGAAGHLELPPHYVASNRNS